MGWEEEDISSGYSQIVSYTFTVAGEHSSSASLAIIYVSLQDGTLLFKLSPTSVTISCVFFPEWWRRVDSSHEGGQSNITAEASTAGQSRQK